MKKFEAMKSVYCYYFPEVRPLVREVERALPDDMFLVTTPASEVETAISGLFAEPLAMPRNADGCIDLDAIHEPVIERIVEAYSNTVPALKNFSYSYPLANGSSEGIFHILAKLRTGGADGINMLNGEYEGFGAQANNLRMRADSHDTDSDFRKIKHGTWFVSNPSAIDGNVLPDGLISEICNAGHDIVLDLAYVGSTSPRTYDVSDERIKAVVMSFSKPYGVFRQRIGGFLFSREEIQTLYGNKWFKDTKRLLQALKLAESVGPEGLHKKYCGVQKATVDHINSQHGLSMRSSDALLIGNIKDDSGLDAYQKEMISAFKRGSGYRFCLTPYFERFERGEIV